MTPLESLLKAHPLPWHPVHRPNADWAVCAAQSADDEYVAAGLIEEEATRITDVVNGLSERVGELEGALKFYANPDNRSACLIDRYEFIEKYFKREYIVDVCETEYLKDNGERANKALGQGAG